MTAEELDPEEAAAFDSRAREALSELQLEQAQAAKVPRDRAQMIHDWMLLGWYVKGRTDRLLAALWGVGRSAVWNYSSTAALMLGQHLRGATLDELVGQLLARMAFIGQDALERREDALTVKGEVVSLQRPDHRTALRAVEAEAELLGVKVQRVHHTVTAGEMTTEQILEQLRAHGVRIELPTVETTAAELPAKGETNGDTEEAGEAEK